MSVLYVDHRNAELTTRDGRLFVGQQSLPLHQVSRIVVQGRASLSTTLVGQLADRGISLTIVDVRHPQRSAELLAGNHNDLRRRLAQFRAAQDSAWRNAWARQLVIAKLHGQHRNLVRQKPARPEHARVLHRAAQIIEARLARLRNETPDLATLRGMEGAAAAVYFAVYGKLLPPAVGFGGRNRRPPRDPGNALLSLAYTLLASEAVTALQRVGLEPLLGFFHEPAFSRYSLAADLIEPLRPRVDIWVALLLRQRTLRLDHFASNHQGCLLQKAGRRLFYGEWETRAPALRRVLRAASRRLVQRLLDEYGQQARQTPDLADPPSRPHHPSRGQPLP